MITALHRAVCSDDIEYLKVLIELDNDPNEESDDRLRLTPLHFAAMSDSEMASELLLRAGAKPNRQAIKGLTPLHVAGLFQSDYSWDILCRYKGDRYAKTYDGFSPDRLYSKPYSFRRNYWDVLRAPIDFASVMRPPIHEVPDDYLGYDFFPEHRRKDACCSRNNWNESKSSESELTEINDLITVESLSQAFRDMTHTLSRLQSEIDAVIKKFTPVPS